MEHRTPSEVQGWVVALPRLSALWPQESGLPDSRVLPGGLGIPEWHRTLRCS